MKSKIFVLNAFLAILMFFSLNSVWAHEPTPRYKGDKSSGYGRDHKGGGFAYKGFIPLTREQKRFQRAEKKAWADGRLTYQEMRRLHQFEKKAIKSLHRPKHHRVPDYPQKRKHISYGHKRYVFPQFSIMFSFSEPRAHIAGTFGVR